MCLCSTLGQCMSPEPCMSFYSKCAESPALNHVPVHCAEQRGIVGMKNGVQTHPLVSWVEAQLARVNEGLMSKQRSLCVGLTGHNSTPDWRTTARGRIYRKCFATLRSISVITVTKIMYFSNNNKTVQQSPTHCVQKTSTVPSIMPLLQKWIE